MLARTGFVSFQEYAQLMALQAQQAETDAMLGDKKSSNKAQALNELYADARKGGDFNEMYKAQYNM